MIGSMETIWKKIAFAPRFLLTALILLWLILMQVSSLALWVVLVNFILMLLIGLLSYARIRVRSVMEDRKEVEPKFYERREFIFVLLIWQAAILAVVLGIYPQAEYSLLPGWLILLSAIPFPLLVLQYYATHRWDVERRRKMEQQFKSGKNNQRKS